jgi:4-hydroxyphenylpyruvate dioxygenase-like putative hemolysin
MDLTGTRITYDEPRPLVSGRAVGVGLADHVIEFVGATGEGPTMDFVNAHGERMHSVAFNVSDLGAAEDFLQSKGIRTLPGSATGRLYLDPAATHGSLIELVSALR